MYTQNLLDNTTVSPTPTNFQTPHNSQTQNAGYTAYFGSREITEQVELFINSKLHKMKEQLSECVVDLCRSNVIEKDELISTLNLTAEAYKTSSYSRETELRFLQEEVKFLRDEMRSNKHTVALDPRN